MHFTSTTIVLAAMSALTLALPGHLPRSEWEPVAASTPTGPATPGSTCLTEADASYLVNGFASLLTSYNTQTAETLLAGDFSDTSDSINFLSNQPAGSTTFPSKQAFELGQGSQPPIGFQLLNIDAITCDVIAFRWAATVSTQGSPIKGINILYAENNSGAAGAWQIKTVYTEFNSGLWSQEVGGVCS